MKTRKWFAECHAWYSFLVEHVSGNAWVSGNARVYAAWDATWDAARVAAWDTAWAAARGVQADLLRIVCAEIEQGEKK